MKKTATFSEVDKELIERIENYQKAMSLPSFIAAVRDLCEKALSLRKIVKDIK